MKNIISTKSTVAFISTILLATSAFSSAFRGGDGTGHLSSKSLTNTIATFNEKATGNSSGSFLAVPLSCPDITKAHTDALKAEGRTVIDGKDYSIVGTAKKFKKNVPDARNVISSNIMNEATHITLSEGAAGAIEKNCTYTWKSVAGAILGGTYTFAIKADTGLIVTELGIDNKNSYAADFLVVPNFNDGTTSEITTNVPAGAKSYLTFLSTSQEVQKLAVQYEGGLGLKKCSQNIPAGSKQKVTFSSTAMIATCKAQ